MRTRGAGSFEVFAPSGRVQPRSTSTACSPLANTRSNVSRIASAVSRVLERSADESGVDDFGLRMAGLRRLATLGPLSVVLREEPDLLE